MKAFSYSSLSIKERNYENYLFMNNFLFVYREI